MKRITFILACALLLQPVCASAKNYEAYRSYLKGVLALKAGIFDVALKDYEKAVSLDSEALAVYKDLAYLYWQSGNNQKAFDCAEKIYQADENNPQTLIFLATFYLVANQPDKSKYFWEKTLEIDPDNETATVYLAAYYYSDNKLKESAEYWNKFLQQQPDSSSGYFQLGMVQEKLNMESEALKSYDKVIELKPEAREAYLAKARIYENTGKIVPAIKEYEAYVAAFPDNLYVLMYLGKNYFENQEYEKAKDVFLKAKKGLSGNESQTASYWLGIIYEKLGSFDKSAAEFEQVLSKEPENVSILARLGYYYSLLKQYSKSEKKLSKAIGIEPLNYELLYLHGLNYLDWKKYDKSIKMLNKVVELKPDFVESYYFMGSAYDKKGDFENAETSFLKAIEVNPDHTRAMNYLGYTYADKNYKLEQAEVLLQKSVQLEPRNGSYLDSLGWLYFRQGKYEEAEKFIHAAANLTTDPLVYEHLGDVYVELGKVGEAWTWYSLSCDTGGEKTAFKKLEMTQKKLSPKEFYGRTLLRADNNYRKIFSLSAGYKMKMSVGGFGVRAYLPFNYSKNQGIEIGVPGRFFTGGAVIHIGNGKVTFEPKAVEESLPEEFNELVDFAAIIFKDDFFKNFENTEISQKGKHIKYILNEVELTINSDNGFITKITKGDLTVEPVKYKQFFNTKVPSVIKASSKKMKFSGTFEASAFSAFDKRIAAEKE